MPADSEGAIFLQQQMVAITKQLSMPLVEVSLVINKYATALRSELKRFADENGEVLSDEILNPIEISKNQSGNADYNVDLSKIVDMTDVDRMDIFDTVIRTAINEHSTPLYDALIVIRDWERIVRTQLALVNSPGQLYSPLELPDDY